MNAAPPINLINVRSAIWIALWIALQQLRPPPVRPLAVHPQEEQ